MSAFEIVAILLAGVAAGTINTVVGSGTLVTFPTLLAFGIPPVTANVSNTILRLGMASLLGGVVGAVLLLWLPSAAFDAIVPVLILLGVVLVVIGPRLSRRVAARAEHTGGLSEHGARWVWPMVALAGVYGGYFGAAQGVLLMAILGIGVADTMQRHNATKNVLALLVNGIAAVLFIVLALVDVPGVPAGLAEVNWPAAGLIAIGSVIGGQIGAKVGRRLPPNALRAVIVVVGVVAIVAFVFPG